jgi:hypothetical protein
MFDTIQCGDRVTIKTPQGQEVTGRAVMFNRKVGAWVLNLGGRHGIPGMACERNFIKVSKAKRDKFALQAAIINGGFGQ